MDVQRPTDQGVVLGGARRHETEQPFGRVWSGLSSRPERNGQVPGSRDTVRGAGVVRERWRQLKQPANATGETPTLLLNGGSSALAHNARADVDGRLKEVLDGDEFGLHVVPFGEGVGDVQQCVFRREDVGLVGPVGALEPVGPLLGVSRAVVIHTQALALVALRGSVVVRVRRGSSAQRKLVLWVERRGGGRWRQVVRAAQHLLRDSLQRRLVESLALRPLVPDAVLRDCDGRRLPGQRWVPLQRRGRPGARA